MGSQFNLSSARATTTCRLKRPKIMNGFKSLCLLILAASSANAAGPNRKGKNLRGTFPFNSGARGNARAAGHAHSHDHDHAHAHAHAQEGPARDARQRNRGDDVALDIGSIAAAGERCIDKVVMVEETEYDDVIECKHSYTQKCHTSYTTDFEPQQEEECEENFIKNCFIDYRKIASEEQIEFCHTPLICDGEGPVECRTVYESQCATRYHERDVEDDVVECETVQEEKCEDVTHGYTTEKKCTKWPKQVCSSKKANVKKYSPETECKKVPKELCGPSGCELKPGPEECFPKTETVVSEVPEETCNLEPQRESAQGLAPTQGKSRSQLSRSGVMFPLLSLVWPNLLLNIPQNMTTFDTDPAQMLNLIGDGQKLQIVHISALPRKYMETYVK